MQRRFFIMAALSLSGCGLMGRREATNFIPAKADTKGLHSGETEELRALINKWADHYDVPRTLVHRSVQRESDYNPSARHGPYYGLMQILPQTARGMGFKGKNSELLNPDVNLQFGVKYLRGAWLCADGSEDRAIMWYAKGYYYEAKRRGILKETGLRA